MPYCWNCDTEATHVYRNHRKERKYLCTTCADAFEVGYCYGQELSLIHISEPTRPY